MQEVKLKNNVKYLAKETLRHETKTRPRRLTFRARPNRDLPTISQDRDITKIGLEIKTTSLAMRANYKSLEVIKAVVQHLHSKRLCSKRLFIV